jgi:hypothetical protein
MEGWRYGIGIVAVTCFECPDARAAAHLKSIQGKRERDKGFIGDNFNDTGVLRLQLRYLRLFLNTGTLAST